MPLGMEVALGPGHIVLDGSHRSPPQRGTARKFRPICCGQMAGWIKMSLSREVGLSSSDIVSDGDQAPTIFGRCLLWPNGWMDQDATWYGSGPQPRPHYVRRGHSSTSPLRERGTAAPSLPSKKGHSPPNFWPMSILAKRLERSRCHLVER